MWRAMVLQLVFLPLCCTAAGDATTRWCSIASGLCTLAMCTALCQGTCWADKVEELQCCTVGTIANAAGCWADGRTLESCCPAPSELGLRSYAAMGVAVAGLLAFCARDAVGWGMHRRHNGVSFRLKRLQALQREIDTASVSRASGLGSQPRAELCGVTAAAAPTFAEEGCFADIVGRAVEPASCSRQCQRRQHQGSRGGGIEAVSLLLSMGEAALLEVLGALDGVSLARWECVGRRASRESVGSLAGLWRLVHVRALGGRPPAALARQPARTSGTGPSGAWKEWWCWRQRALAQSDEERRAAAARLAGLLLQPPIAGTEIAEAEVQPMKPSEAWLGNLFASLRERLGADFTQSADPRFAALPRRWHCHAVVAGEAVLADAQGFHADHLRLFASWSCCFSAATGQPRLFHSVVQHSAAGELWRVDLLHCRIPARASASWACIAEETVRVRAAGRSLASALCGVAQLAHLELRGPDWSLERCDLATAAELASVAKELFGSPGVAGGDATLLRLLQWLLAATCPNPFAEAPRALLLTSQQLSERLPAMS